MVTPILPTDYLTVIFIAQEKCLAKKFAYKNVPERQKNCVKISQTRLKDILFYIFAFKSQMYAQVVENFVQTCVWVSATFRNSAYTLQSALHCGDLQPSVALLGPSQF